MYDEKTKQHFSGHLRNSGFRNRQKGQVDGKPRGPHEGRAEKPADTGLHDQHAEHPRHQGSQPHPATGVHGVHIHHMGGGRAQTHTYHDQDDKPEVREHGTLDEAHAHAQDMLPPTHSEPDADDNAQYAEDNGPMDSIGAMA